MGKRRRPAKGIILWGLAIPFLQVCFVNAGNPSTLRTTGGHSSGMYGDSCTTIVECTFQGSICESGRCTCAPQFDATNQLDKCGKVASFNESCFFNEQCELFSPETKCSDGVCVCLFEREGIIRPDGTPECVAVTPPDSPGQYVGPTMIAILVVMCLMFIILCVVLRLFSRERWRENRTIFNTPNPRLMNVSLLRESSKHGDRRGSKTSTRGPISRPHSPSLQGSRRGSKTGSNASLKSAPKSPVGLTSGNKATTPVLENVTVETRNAKA